MKSVFLCGAIGECSGAAAAAGRVINCVIRTGRWFLKQYIGQTGYHQYIIMAQESAPIDPGIEEVMDALWGFWNGSLVREYIPDGAKGLSSAAEHGE